MAQDIPDSIPQALIQALRQAVSVAVLTGAGISAESGIPTFRGAQTGLWAQYDPHELATPEAFASNPRLVMDWYRWRLSLVEQSAPNAGHLALVEMEKQVPRFTLITQNVDGLHRQAGSRNVIELHGSIQRLTCSGSSCGYTQEGWIKADLPTCPRCGRLLRPAVVWFGEALPRSALESALEAAQTCDIFFAVGTSGVVEPAASLPFEALRSGAVLVEINPQRTPLSDYTNYTVSLSAGKGLPDIISAAWPG